MKVDGPFRLPNVGEVIANSKSAQIALVAFGVIAACALTAIGTVIVMAPTLLSSAGR